MWRDGTSVDDIARTIGRTSAAVSVRLHRHRAAGAAVPSRHELLKWTPERDERLLALWGTSASGASIASALGTSERSCQARIAVLRALCPWLSERKPSARCADCWTVAEEAVVREMRSRNLTARQIAAALGRTKNAVTARVVNIRRRGGDMPTVSPGPRPA
jgi:hypothetical protein